MTITILVGETGAGKSTELIKTLRSRRECGKSTSLYLSNHPFLSQRPNVKPGGLMGCRTAGLTFPITDVVSSEGLARMLEAHAEGDVVALDEAQYFDRQVAPHLLAASARGIDILVGMPSHQHFDGLVKAGAIVVKIDHSDNVADLEQMLREGPPFPGEKKAYQPLFGLDLKDFGYVREDCPARLDLMLSTCRKTMGFGREAPQGATYVDVGCCSGYFVEGMGAAGFRSTGVDVQKVFIDMAQRVCAFRGSGATYLEQNAYDFAKQDDAFDVISCFATIQWVMIQRGYAEGLEALENLMARAGKVFVLEMGYSSEDIYKGKIDVPIDRRWTHEVLAGAGFDRIELFEAGKRRLWRDVFVATR